MSSQKLSNKPKKTETAKGAINARHYRFKKTADGNFLITNDWGDYCFLTKEQFEDFSQNVFNKDDEKFIELSDKDFIGGKKPSLRMIKKYRSKNHFLTSKGPSLHIVVLTLRCNHKCVYCQVNAVDAHKENRDLDIPTAKRIVDLIFQSPNKNIAIEFQGGEPTLNWLVLKFIVEYAREKNKTEKRNLELRLVTNFSVMDDEKLEFLFKNLVSISTSLDGPQAVHDRNRVFVGNKQGSYATVSKWLKKAFSKFKAEKEKNGKSEYIWQPGAITTVSKNSLKFHKEIIDEYQKWGFENVFLRPVNSFGVAKNIWEKVGYTSDEYLEFYKKALDYIISLNKKGKVFRELLATNMLMKIMTDTDPNYSELRSPCSAGIGQMLYNYDGSIFTCDEGRMVGGEEFMIGNVQDATYQDVIENGKVKSVCMASCLDNLPCDHCAYKPYCGTCPVNNYVNYGSLFSPATTSERCKIYKAILDFLFEKLKDDDVRKIFEQWVVRENEKKTVPAIRC